MWRVRRSKIDDWEEKEEKRREKKGSEKKRSEEKTVIKVRFC